MTREEQLRKQIEVLREALGEAHDLSLDAMGLEARDTLLNALAESDRIAEEQVEETDWEVVWEWVVAKRNRAMTLDAESLRLWVEDGNPVFEGGLPTAAAWIRAQKEAGSV